MARTGFERQASDDRHNGRVGQTTRPGGVDRFGLEPRPPSPPPAFLRLPWWLRWPIGYAVAAAFFAGWVLAIVEQHDRPVVVWIAAPYLATPMVVLAVLLIRSRRDGPVAETPRAFGWGAILSLVSLLLLTLGYVGWGLMAVTTPTALAFLLYALTEPPTGRRGRAALTSLVVVLIGLVVAFADLSDLQAAAG